jgi:hypothetical protein
MRREIIITRPPLFLHVSALMSISFGGFPLQYGEKEILELRDRHCAAWVASMACLLSSLPARERTPRNVPVSEKQRLPRADGKSADEFFFRLRPGRCSDGP